MSDGDDTEKADTAYQNPDGIEVEVDIEGDVTASSYDLFDGPAAVAQFGLTYLRKRGQFYLESLAEDSASVDRVEWKSGANWITTKDAQELSDRSALKHFRIRGVNAVLLLQERSRAKVGEKFPATVPVKPFTLMSDVGDRCGDTTDHIALGQSVYWYLWTPEKSGCDAQTQELSIVVSKVLPKGPTTYPEYDKLTADKKITAVVLFGQIGDGAIEDTDPGMRGYERMTSQLEAAGFAQVPAPLGRRLSKTIKGIDVEIDLYSPHEFSGLGDYAHFGNFQKAISEHEIVAYDGHSMLGASDFWARPTYPSFYQMFLYGGCLGYEYYIRPIVGQKGGWANVDILSSVVEVTASATEFASPVLSKIVYAIDHQYRVSWKSILSNVRSRVGDSTFGVSGVRDNCYTPSGSRCN